MLFLVYFCTCNELWCIAFGFIQVLDNNGEAVFEVDYKESRKTFTPAHIAVAIYKKMLGKLT